MPAHLIQSKARVGHEPRRPEGHTPIAARLPRLPLLLERVGNVLILPHLRAHVLTWRVLECPKPVSFALKQAAARLQT